MLLIFAFPANAGQVAKLIAPTKAHTDPSNSARAIMNISTTQPLTGAATTLAITDSVYDRNGTRWLKVMLPGRGHSKGGWISSNHVRIQTNNWVVKVSRKTRYGISYQSIPDYYTVEITDPNGKPVITKQTFAINQASPVNGGSVFTTSATSTPGFYVIQVTSLLAKSTSDIR